MLIFGNVLKLLFIGACLGDFGSTTVRTGLGLPSLYLIIMVIPSYLLFFISSDNDIWIWKNNKKYSYIYLIASLSVGNSQFRCHCIALTSIQQVIIYFVLLVQYICKKKRFHYCSLHTNLFLNPWFVNKYFPRLTLKIRKKSVKIQISHFQQFIHETQNKWVRSYMCPDYAANIISKLYATNASVASKSPSSD